MPVMFKCKTCGREHQTHMGWDSMEKFDAVPSDKPMGEWSCPDTRRAPNEKYTKADLRWHSDYEHATWEELEKLHHGAEQAFKNNTHGSARQLDEIEMEMDTRKFQVVARFPDKKVVWDRFRTKARCETYLKGLGLAAGHGHVHNGVSYEIAIEPVTK